MNEPAQLSGPDLASGVALSAIADGAMMQGHAHGEPVLVVRRADELFAIGAVCTHYGAPLADGLLVDDTVRCPWHHACFSLRTGAALRAPALDPVACWRVEQQEGSVYVREKLVPANRSRCRRCPAHRNRSLSWAAALRATPLPRRSGARDMPAASRC